MFFLVLVGGRLYPMPKFKVLMMVSVYCCDEWFSNLFGLVLIKCRLDCYFFGGARGGLDFGL